MSGQIFLTDGVLENILSRMPLASLGRMACLCKAFDGVLRAAEFGFLFQRHAPKCVCRHRCSCWYDVSSFLLTHHSNVLAHGSLGISQALVPRLWRELVMEGARFISGVLR